MDIQEKKIARLLHMLRLIEQRIDYWIDFYKAEKIGDIELNSIVSRIKIHLIQIDEETDEVMDYEFLDLMILSFLLTRGVEIDNKDEIIEKSDKLFKSSLTGLRMMSDGLRELSLKDSGLENEKATFKGRELKFTKPMLLQYAKKNDLLPYGNDWFKVQTDLFEFRKKFISPQDSSSSPNIKKEIANKTLRDIWIKDKHGMKDSYDEIIDRLQQSYNTKEKDIKFLKNVQGELYWERFHGYIKYLQGFIIVMLEKKWLNNEISAPDWIKILSNTFNIPANTDPKPFQPSSLQLSSLDEKYILPFLDFESNE